jgi:hypothetical protein
LLLKVDQECRGRFSPDNHPVLPLIPPSDWEEQLAQRFLALIVKGVLALVAAYGQMPENAAVNV